MPDILKDATSVFGASLGAVVAGYIGIKILKALWAKVSSPGIEKTADDEITRSKFLAGHNAEQSAAKLLFHHLFLLYRVLGQKAVDDAVASNTFNAATVFKVKSDILTALRPLLSLEFFYSIARELGFIYTNPQATTDAIMAHAGNIVDDMINKASKGEPITLPLDPQTVIATLPSGRKLVVPPGSPAPVDAKLSAVLDV